MRQIIFTSDYIAFFIIIDNTLIFLILFQIRSFFGIERNSDIGGFMFECLKVHSRIETNYYLFSWFFFSFVLFKHLHSLNVFYNQ
jgi:hypothetical protein